MNIMLGVLTKLSESELLEHFESLVARDRRTTARLLVAIDEIDQRKLWAAHACPSMFAFCVERFHMSEAVTAKRIWAARTARRFPVVLEMVERGELHLSAIHLLARHLTPQNCSDVLRRARHKSSREIERLVAALAPRPDVASRIRALPRKVLDAAPGGAAASGADADASAAAASGADAAALAAGGIAKSGIGSGSSGAADSIATSSSATASSTIASTANASCANASRVAANAGSKGAATTPESGPAARPITALSPRRYKIEVTVDEETHDKLRSLQDLLGRSEAGRDPAAIVSRAIDVLLVETLKRKAATTDRPRPAPASSDDARRENPEGKSRSIPAALRRAVWRRDCGRCRYEDGRGRRCNATRDVEFHHKAPFARRGCHDADNIELRCAAHNQYQADLDFGRDFMDARRGAAGATPVHSPRNVA